MEGKGAPPVCPSCGEFAALQEETGWCRNCSKNHNKVSKLEGYLAKNADEIEHYILQGCSVNTAIDKLHSRKARPSCIVCGEVIARAARTSIFCRSKPDCRRYARRYTYLYQQKGLTKTEALAKVYSELT